MQRPRFRTLATAALLLALTGGGAYAVYARIQDEGAEKAAKEGADALAPTEGVETSASGSFNTDVPIPVEGTAAVRDELVISVSAAGQAEAWQKTVIVATVGGRIASLPVRESDGVGSGQLLLGLDPAEYGLAVEEAEAALRDAQAKYRELTVFDDRITDEGTRRDRAAAARSRSGLDAAEVKLRRARLDLARTRLTAPFAGRVASLKVVPGQWVRQGDEILTIVDLDPIKVEVQVLESEVSFLSPGRRAHISFAAFPGERFTGTVQTINPVVDGQTRTARVTVLVPNPDRKILPGMYARVSLDARRFGDRLLVPRSAILERDGRPMLFVFEPGGDGDSGLAKWRYVTLGMQNDSLVEIVPGDETLLVEPGEVVLTDGHYTLIHDARIRVVEDVKEAGGRPQ